MTCYRREQEVLGEATGTQNKPKFGNTVTFAALPEPQEKCRTVSQQAATAHINDIAIGIYPGMDAELFKTLLEVVHTC